VLERRCGGVGPPELQSLLIGLWIDKSVEARTMQHVVTPTAFFGRAKLVLNEFGVGFPDVCVASNITLNQ